MKKIAILLTSLLIITSCWTTNDNSSKKDTENKTSVEKNSNNSEKKSDDLEKEFMNNEDFKMHMSSIDNWDEIEAIMQKNGKNMSIEFVKMTTKEDMPVDMKMKKMLVKDNFFYTNMEIWGKDIWLKWKYDQEAQEEFGFIDVKKFLKKIKEENSKKEAKDIDGTQYDCYSGKFLDWTEMCFTWEDLKYVIDDWSKMKIIEYTNKIDTAVFKVPSDDKITSQKEFMKMMMWSIATPE